MSFTYPHEAHLAKIKLESEGIETILKDELTAQVNNFYSNAIGGVKLLVKDENLVEATQIMIDGGFLNPTAPESNAFLKWFDTFSSKIPFIGTTILEFRLIVIIGLGISLLVSALVLLTATN